MKPPAKLTMPQMAELIERRVVERCQLQGGEFAGETWLRVEEKDIDGLKQVMATLKYLAPHADAIKRAIEESRR